MKRHLVTAAVNWFSKTPLLEGRTYEVHTTGFSCLAEILSIKHAQHPIPCARTATDKSFHDQQIMVDLALHKKPALNSSVDNATHTYHFLKDSEVLGSFAVKHTLRRSINVTWQSSDIDREIRANLKNQRPKTLWFTGLSGSGKSTLANAVEKRLVASGYHTMLLDGDNVRHGLNKNLGFTEVDRIENIRRVAEVAKLMNDAGLVVTAAFITPYEADRVIAKNIIGESFVEIHVSTSLEECERRDPKGLYAQARAGIIPNFTGINDPYEEPTTPCMRIDTKLTTIKEAVNDICDLLLK